MVSVRTGKSKGSQMEYDCQYSLSKVYPDIYKTSERGFQLQYDLECDEGVFECKRLKGMSWNQAKKFYEKLLSVAPEGKEPYLLFKSNRQPCLVMTRTWVSCDTYFLCVNEFVDTFGVPFEKHPSTRSKK